MRLSVAIAKQSNRLRLAAIQLDTVPARRRARRAQQLRLAAIQLDTVPCEVNLNVRKAMQWTRRAFEEGARFVFLHEGLTADYSPDPMRDGRPLESWEVFGFQALAKRHQGYVALGLNEIWRRRPFISMVFLGPEGIVGVYRKSYLWPNDNQLDQPSFAAFLKTYVPHERGYRLERGVLGHGDGTKVIEVGGIRIGCVICADSSQPRAWHAFKRSRPDLIFWQNNRTNVLKDGRPQQQARELKTPMVVTNRCGFTYHIFTEGGSCFIADDGSVVAKANERGDEEMILADLPELHRLPRQKRANHRTKRRKTNRQP